jgi:Flp pilus assembly protein TadD
LAAIAALVGAILVAHLARQRAPGAFVFAAWYGIGLLPVLNLVPLPHLMADRFLYLSSIGAFGLAAWLVGKLVVQLPDRRIGALTLESGFILVLGLLVGGACIAGTRARLPVWSDSEALWRDTLNKTPTAEVAHSNLGRILADRGDHATAIVHYRRALELRPDFADARVNLANALVRLGRIEDALEIYGEALTLDPRDVEARYNLAVALILSGEAEPARVQLEKVLEYDPAHGRAHNQLAVAALRVGRDAEALGRLDAAVAAEPLLAEAHFHRAIALGRLGREHEAIAALERVIELQPDHARAHLQLGLTLLSSRQVQGVERGRQVIQRALKLDPSLASQIPAPLADDAGAMNGNGH